jgi:hypothetical protein
MNGKARHKGRRSCSVGFIGALYAITGDNVVKNTGIDSCAFNNGFHNMSGKLRSANIFKSSTELSYRRSHSPHDHDIAIFSHISYLPECWNKKGGGVTPPMLPTALLFTLTPLALYFPVAIFATCY